MSYLKLTGIVLCGWQMARALLIAVEKQNEDLDFHSAKIATAQFFAQHVLPQAGALEAAITSARGNEGILALDASRF